MKGFATRAVHGAAVRRDAYGGLRMPVYDCVAFEFETAKDMQLSFEGKKPAHAYSRITNPTVEDFEARMRLAVDAMGVLAFGSGMAAIANTIVALAETGTNLVTTDRLFGNTLSLFRDTLGPLGIETRLVNMNDAGDVERAIDGDTRAVFLEVMTNPQLEVADVRSLSGITKRHGVPLIADGTLTTPFMFRSRDFGVDLEIISTTKYISGGATSLGGVLIDNGTFDWGKSPKLKDRAQKVGPYALLMLIRREVNRNLGTCLSAHNAYLQSLGLETLELRAGKSEANAAAIAGFLSEQPEVLCVHYPGLPSSPFHGPAKAQFDGRFGSLLTFHLPDRAACFRFLDALEVIRRATNLQDNKTLAVHPASTIFCEYSEEERRKMGVDEGMVRLSVGIEDVADLLKDIRKGLDRT